MGMSAFFLGALINDVQLDSLLAGPGIPTEAALAWLQFLFSAEGALYAVGSYYMVGIMTLTPSLGGGGPTGTMRFAIVMAGGIFFAFSGLVYPPCITNVMYVFSKQACSHPAAAATPYVWNAMAHFGITCFMVGTTIGMRGVWRAPKGRFVSPFWGCAMYFLGAWTIGVFKFWGPVLCGGFDPSANTPVFDLTAPAQAWTWTWWLGLLGAFLLTMGALIFALIDGTLGIR